MSSSERQHYLEQANTELAHLIQRWYEYEITQQDYQQDRAYILAFLLAHKKKILMQQLMDVKTEIDHPVKGQKWLWFYTFIRKINLFKGSE